MRKLLFSVFLLSALYINGYSQNSNDILNVLVQKNLVTQAEADSLRADAAIKQQESDAKKKSFPVTASKAFQLSGYTHIRYRYSEEKGKVNGLDIRRARLEAKGAVNPYWNYRIQFDFGGSTNTKANYSPKLLDAYAEWKIADELAFTFGQFNIPLSLENNTSDKVLDVINRSQAVEALAARSNDSIGDNNGRDIGVQVSGSFLKINDLPLFDYKVAVFNGSGINTEDWNNKKDFAARLGIHPVKGLNIGTSVYHGIGYYGAPSKASHLRNRYGFDVSYDYNDYSLRAEYLHGTDKNVNRSGYYIQAGYYVISQTLQTVVKYDVFDKDLDKADNKITDYIIGLNYIISTNSKVQAIYTFRKEEKNEVHNDYAALQLQIGF